MISEDSLSFGKYELVSPLGRGAFGVVYKGRNRKTGEPVVIKTESINAPISTLKHETTLLNWLYSKSCRHIPPVYWYGVSSPYRALIIPFYSRCLEQYVQTTVQHDLNAISSIMRSAILILKDIHSKFIVHRDIKPANWMINGDELVLIDFGLAAFYVDSEDAHIVNATEPRTDIIGTPKFISWNIHCGYTPSRRDDMVSLAYIGLYMLTGGELWTNRRTVLSSLESTNIYHPMNQWLKAQKELGVIIPAISEAWPQLAKYMEEVYALGFQEMPLYDLYANSFEPK